jgi:hypothetical protein
MLKAVPDTSLFKAVESFHTPFSYSIGHLNASLLPLLRSPAGQHTTEALCSYGFGRRRQFKLDGSPTESDLCRALAEHDSLRAFALEHSQAALACDLKGEDIQIQARRCLDESDYFLSPHADCPKTICVFLIYLWTGARGTSLYTLNGYSQVPPAPEPGMRERVNNFNGNKEYQRRNRNVITMLKPDCFASFEHVHTISPMFGSFLFIPNTRFRKAMPDLPTSYHGVASSQTEGETHEARDLILIDVKLAHPAPARLRSTLKARLRRLVR